MRMRCWTRTCVFWQAASAHGMAGRATCHWLACVIQPHFPRAPCSGFVFPPLPCVFMLPPSQPHHCGVACDTLDGGRVLGAGGRPRRLCGPQRSEHSRAAQFVVAHRGRLAVCCGFHVVLCTRQALTAQRGQAARTCQGLVGWLTRRHDCDLSSSRNDWIVYTKAHGCTCLTMTGGGRGYDDHFVRTHTTHCLPFFAPFDDVGICCGCNHSSSTCWCGLLRSRAATSFTQAMHDSKGTALEPASPSCASDQCTSACMLQPLLMASKKGCTQTHDTCTI